MWVNEWIRPCLIDRMCSFSCESFMTDRAGLDGTTLYYLAVQRAMVSVHRPVHSEITLTYLLTWHWSWPLYTPKNGFQGAIKRQGSPFLSFAQVFSALIAETSTIRLCSSLVTSSSLPSLYPLRHSRINYSRASTTFSYCKRRKAGRGLGTRLTTRVVYVFFWRPLLV